jgi:hypothetical protein
LFLVSGATVSGAGGSLFIAPTSKWAIGESFTEQVRWTSLDFDENSLKVGQGPDKSGLPDKSSGGLWGPAGASRIRSQTKLVR